MNKKRSEDTGLGSPPSMTDREGEVGRERLDIYTQSHNKKRKKKRERKKEDALGPEGRKAGEYKERKRRGERRERER